MEEGRRYGGEGPLAAIEVGNFPDGEISVKLNQNIRGRDVFLIQPTGPPVNDNLVELLILIDTCKRASAERITAVLPYFGYARQDRKDAGRVPITSKLVANLITKAGADRVLLDNMSDDLLAQAVAVRDRLAPHVTLEASGNMTPVRLPAVAASGVDYVSAGGLTHSAPALDISLNFIPLPETALPEDPK